MLKFLTLKRFKCFEDLMIQLAPLTLITGVNGAGKSTIIQSLLLVRQSFKDKKYNIDDHFRINGDLVSLGNSASIHNIDSNEENVVICLEDSDGSSVSFDIDTSDIDSVAKTENVVGDLEGAEQKWAIFDDNFAYLYSDRGHPMSRYERRDESSTDSRLGNRYGSNTAFCLQKAINDSKDVSVKGLWRDGKTSVLDNVSLWSSYILGENINIASNEIDKTHVELTYSFKNKRGEDVSFSPLAMAFGNSYILPIIVGLLTAPEGSMFIVENPEAHLHPSAQTRLGEFLALAAENGIQVIVETHSDHLVNGVRLAIMRKQIKAYNVETNYFIVKNGQHGNLRVDIDEGGKMNNWPAGFFDEWEESLMKLAKGNRDENSAE